MTVSFIRGDSLSRTRHGVVVMIDGNQGGNQGGDQLSAKLDLLAELITGRFETLESRVTVVEVDTRAIVETLRAIKTGLDRVNQRLARVSLNRQTETDALDDPGEIPPGQVRH